MCQCTNQGAIKAAVRANKNVFAFAFALYFNGYSTYNKTIPRRKPSFVFALSFCINEPLKQMYVSKKTTSKSDKGYSGNQSTESAESRKLLEQHNLLNGVGMLDTFDPHLQVKTDRCVTFMSC